MEYTVCFTRYYTYDVEADNADDAFNQAYSAFKCDNRCPIADLSYDEVEIESRENVD